MLQALCWPAAKLAGLACVVATGSGNVLLVHEGTCPRWFAPWLARLLKGAGVLREGERPVAYGEINVAARAKLSRGEVRAEFSPGAVARLIGMELREREDFSLLRTRVEGRRARR